jgi:FAD/FMN-containing dehydrogenase
MAATSVDTTLEALQTTFRGDLITPASPDYDEVRKVYNAMIDRRPVIIARCLDAGDVIAAVNYAREHDLLLAVRGGGHHGAGLSLCDDGIVVDLSLMKGVRVDPVNRTALVMPGCTQGDVDHATHAFGLATPTGIISTTGVAGLTLGGGTGHLSRRYGLTIDNLLSADLVLADGSFVTASETQHPELFWAIRGGGGNFGVVTAFEFRLHPVDTIVGGPMFWPLEQMPEVLRWYRDFIRTAPEDVNGFFATTTILPAQHFPEAFHGKTLCAIIWCHTGPAEEAERIFASIRATLPPVLDLVGPLPFTALQGMFDTRVPPGMQWYWKADFFSELPDVAIDIHLRFGEMLPNLNCTMHMYPINGAVHRVGRNDTAFSYRDVTWAVVFAGMITTWARDYWEALHPFSAGGAYVNMMMEEGDDRIRAAYRDNHDRLAEIKATYDPDNLFRMNQNIKPRP